MKTSIILLGALAAILPAGSVDARVRPIETISYQTTACFGTCPVYTLTVRSDGTATFEGARYTAVRGRRDFRVTPRQYRAFAAWLAPVRPARGSVDHSGSACRSMATDMPSVTVTWRGRRGEQRLHHYYGCDMERNRALAERLSHAPDQLPIRDYIGRQR